MEMKRVEDKGNFISRTKKCLDEADIHALILLPPCIGFGCLLSFALLYKRVSGDRLSPTFSCIAIGIASLISAFSGYAEIYKKEMPGLFGRTFEGKTAVISGILTMGMFIFLGIVMFVCAFIQK